MEYKNVLPNIKALMKNKLFLPETFLNLIFTSGKMYFHTYLGPKKSVIQLTSLIVADFNKIGPFSNSLIYTLSPTAWHWGLDSTITWQNSSISWKRVSGLTPIVFTIQACS